MFSTTDCELKIEESFNRMLNLIKIREQNDSDAILTNIYKGGPSPEHWLKFELFSQLSHGFRGTSWEVLVEKRYHGPRIDIAISFEGDLVVVLELKLIANWSFTDSQQKGILKDIKKLNAIDNPNLIKYILVFTQFAKPKHEQVDWMRKQISGKTGVSEEPEFTVRVKNLLQAHPKEKIRTLQYLETTNRFFDKLTLGGVLIKV